MKKIAYILIACFIGFQTVHAQSFTPISSVDATDATSFKKALLQCQIEDDAAYSNEIFSNRSGAFLHNLKSADSWVKFKGTQSQKTEVKYYWLVFFAGEHDATEVLWRGRELVKSPYFQNHPNLPRTYKALIEALKYTEQYNEVLDLYPEFYEANIRVGSPIKYQKTSMLTGVARVYYMLKNYPKAIEQYKLAVIEFERQAEYFQKGSTLNDIALSFGHLKLRDSALAYYNLAIKNIDNADRDAYNRHLRKVIVTNKAEYLIQDGKYNEALPYFFAELESAKKMRELHIEGSDYYNLARIYFLQKNYKRALFYADSLIAFQKKFQQNSIYIKALDIKSKCLLTLGQADEANTVDKWRSYLSDSLEMKKALQSHANATAKYEAHQKDEELTKTNIKLNAETDKVWYRNIALFVLILGLLATLFFYNQLLKNRKTIAAQKAQAEDNLKEKEMLLKEIHHRVKNNMQVVSGLLDIQAYKTSNEQFDRAVKEAKQQIESMMLVHEMLYQTEKYSYVKMLEYLNRLSQQLTVDESHVTVKIVCGDIKLSLEKVTPIGLIISELVSNTIKHGLVENIGSIVIELTEKEGNNISLLYTDNGRGIDPKVNIDKLQTFGLKLIKRLCEEIGGKCQITNDDGFRFCIEFIDEK
ncbi:MAG: hypothetical protein COA58_12575 [Bacteroidetes bacterium]|nr:MAG: hypothetical protein COA58_12575 [Bacteroidota bacterium]